MEPELLLREFEFQFRRLFYVGLYSIEFNHDIASLSNSALNARINQDFEIEIPEYVRSIWGIDLRPLNQRSVVYVINQTRDQEVFIRVTFTLNFTVYFPMTFEVKATGGGIMGQLDPVSLVFSAGSNSATINIPLSKRDFQKIGKYDISWDWFFKTPNETSWTKITTTAHRIFLILDTPREPWVQTFADQNNPWTELLEHSCTIASGCKTEINAVKKIAKYIHKNYNLKYDTVNGRARYISNYKFKLPNWINYVLDGNAPEFPIFCSGTSNEHKDFWIVNCYDCAASLSIMAKVLGILLEYNFHDDFGYLKYVEPIGRGKCNNPFYQCSGDAEVGEDDHRSWFGNHAYTKLNDQVNDACMRQWVPTIVKFLLFISYLCSGNKIYLERANGWLLDLTQDDFENKTIDVSQSWEALEDGGSPDQRDITI